MGTFVYLACKSNWLIIFHYIFYPCMCLNQKTCVRRQTYYSSLTILDFSHPLVTFHIVSFSLLIDTCLTWAPTTLILLIFSCLSGYLVLCKFIFLSSNCKYRNVSVLSPKPLSLQSVLCSCTIYTQSHQHFLFKIPIVCGWLLSLYLHAWPLS